MGSAWQWGALLVSQVYACRPSPPHRIFPFFTDYKTLVCLISRCLATSVAECTGGCWCFCCFIQISRPLFIERRTFVRPIPRYLATSAAECPVSSTAKYATNALASAIFISHRHTLTYTDKKLMDILSQTNGGAFIFSYRL